MPKMLPQRNQLTYAGLYTDPAFSLWGKGAVILDGLYRSFRSLGISASDIQVERGTGSPLDEAVAVYFGNHATYRFKFDRVDATLNDFSDEDLSRFGEILSIGNEWLRTDVPNNGFGSHLFSYATHSLLENGTAAEFLGALGTTEIGAIGTSQGTGLIWHGEREADKWRVQFTLDHSLLTSGGIFAQFILIALENRIDYPSVIAKGREVLNQALSEIGLTFQGESVP